MPSSCTCLLLTRRHAIGHDSHRIQISSALFTSDIHSLLHSILSTHSFLHLFHSLYIQLHTHSRPLQSFTMASFPAPMPWKPFKIIGTRIPDIAYTTRAAVRTIIPSADYRKVLILFIESGQYYKIPGGGVEAGEDHLIAAAREALEETGCIVDVEGEWMCAGVIGKFVCLHHIDSELANTARMTSRRISWHGSSAIVLLCRSSDKRHRKTRAYRA